MMAGGRRAGGRKKDKAFHFSPPLLRGPAWRQKLARVLEGLRYIGRSTMGLFSSSQM